VAAEMTPFTFARVRGQERALASLRDAVAADRVAQAYLFHGPWGVGKTTSALALAAALNCEAAPGERPCGTCLPCRKTARFNHPDVHLVVPVFPAGLWKEEAEKGSADEPGESALCRLYGEWARDPLHVWSWPKRPSIATEWVLEIKGEASRKTFEGRSKVIVFAGVDTMGIEASNRILKMLEEPGPSTVFILTTSRLHQVLPTIRSRCQRISFGEVPTAEVESLLVDQMEVPPAEAPHLAALARGSVGRAVLLHGQGILEVREWTLDMLALEGTELVSQLSVEVLGESRRWDAGRVRQVAEVLMTWYRDLLTLMHGLPDDRVANRDRLDALKREAGLLDGAEVGRRVRLLEDLVQAVDRQVTPSLALFSTLTELSAPAPAAP